VETNFRFDFFNETKINIPVYMNEIINAYFDENNNLKINGYYFNSLMKNYFFTLSKSNLNNSPKYSNFLYDNSFASAVAINPINDSISLQVTAYSGSIYKFEDSTRTLVSQYLPYGFNTGYDFKFKYNNIFISGLKSQTTSSDKLKCLYIYNWHHDTVREIVIDTVREGKVVYGIDLIDTNHIYTGSNQKACYYQPTLNCDNYIRVYSYKMDGTENWRRTLGGFANYGLYHVLATQDTGVLILVQRHDENDINPSVDFYWAKFDKNGVQDTSYFSGFRDITSISELQSITKINVFPNPANHTLHFKLKSHENYSVEVFNLLGEKIISTKLKNKTLNIETLQTGMYVFILKDSKNRFFNGKFVKN